MEERNPIIARFTKSRIASLAFPSFQLVSTASLMASRYAWHFPGTTAIAALRFELM